MNIATQIPWNKGKLIGQRKPLKVSCLIKADHLFIMIELRPNFEEQVFQQKSHVRFLMNPEQSMSGNPVEKKLSGEQILYIFLRTQQMDIEYYWHLSAL